MSNDPIPDLPPLAPGEALAAVQRVARLAPLAGAMTVRDLMARLQALDPKTLVVLAKDAEGNVYSPLDSLTRGYYAPDNRWNGRFYEAGGIWTATDGAPAVCLEPRN